MRLPARPQLAGRLTLIAVALDGVDRDAVGRYFDQLATAGRLPRDMSTLVVSGIDDAHVPRPDIAVIALPEAPDLDEVRRTTRRLAVSCLLVTIPARRRLSHDVDATGPTPGGGGACGYQNSAPFVDLDGERVR